MTTTARRVILAALLLLTAACAAGTDTATSAEDPPAGVPQDDQASGAPSLPSVALTTFDGRPTDLQDLVGAPLVVNFWASWCPPCAAEMPDFESVHQLAGDRLAIVGINISDDPQLADELAERTGVTYPLLRDPDGASFAAVGGIGMPTTLFVDAEGRVVGRHTGVLTEAGLLGEIEAHLGVAVPG